MRFSLQLVALLALPALAYGEASFDQRLDWAWKSVQQLGSRGQFGHQAMQELKGDLPALAQQAGKSPGQWAKLAHLVEGILGAPNGKTVLEWSVPTMSLRRIAGLSKEAVAELAKHGSAVVGLKANDYHSANRQVGSLQTRAVKGGGETIEGWGSPAYGSQIKVQAQHSLTSGGSGNRSFDGGRFVIAHSAQSPQPLFSAFDEHLAELSLSQLLAERKVGDSGRRVLLHGRGTDVQKNRDAKVTMLFEPKTGLGVRIATPKERWKDVQPVQLRRRVPHGGTRGVRLRGK